MAVLCPCLIVQINDSPWTLFLRSSACDRPRTYDRFYQKTPGNFHDPTATSCNHSKSHSGVTETDSAISVCSSEEDKRTASNGNGSSSNAQPPPAGSTSAPSQRKVKKTKKKRGELQYSRYDRAGFSIYH